MRVLQPSDGEVIDYSGSATVHVWISLVLGLVAVCLGTLFAVQAGPSYRWSAITAVLCLIPSLLGLILIGCALMWWRYRRRLILGADRMQLLEGNWVAYDLPYDNIARVVLVPESDGDFYVGIAVSNRDAFDRQLAHQHWLWRYPSVRLRKKYGYDVVITPACAEPVERVYEVVQTCLHRHRRLERERSAR